MTWGGAGSGNRENRVTHILSTTGGMAYHGRLVSENAETVTIAVGRNAERKTIARANIKTLVSLP